MTRTRLTISIISGVAALWLLWATASNIYFTPRRELLDHIASGQKEIARREAVVATEINQRRQLRDVAARSLGATAEETVSTLRARLNTIGHGIGLADLRVSTTTARQVGMPASSAYRDDKWKALTRQPDFYTVGAEFSGQGTFEQAVRSLEIISAEPYIKRIERFTLRPRRAGEVVDISISLTTVVIPGADPAPLPEPDVAMASMYAAVTGKNMFRAPPPPPAPAQAVKPEVKPPVVVHAPLPVPYGEWVVTGIVWIDHQPELWLKNNKTNESRQLRSGDRILDAHVEEITLTQAVVSIDGSKFSLEIGQSLGDRRPVNQ